MLIYAPFVRPEQRLITVDVYALQVRYAKAHGASE